VYLSPIHEDEDEEEGVDCECRRIDQEQLSFQVGFYNARGMKKRVGFQFNALEDTVESIGLEMVEQLALNPYQVGVRVVVAGGCVRVLEAHWWPHVNVASTRHLWRHAAGTAAGDIYVPHTHKHVLLRLAVCLCVLQVRAIADRIRAALEAMGITSNGALTAAAPAGASEGALGASQEPAIGETGAFAIVATAAATAAIEEASSAPGDSVPSSPFAAGAAAAAAAAGDSGPFAVCGEAPAGSRGSSLSGPIGALGLAGSTPASRQGSLGHSPGLLGLQGTSSGQFAGGTSPTALDLLGVSPGSAAAVAAAAGSTGAGGDAAAAGAAGGVRMCPQQLVRQLSMLGRGTATALLANLQEDLLQQSYASPQAAAAIGLESADTNGSLHGGVAVISHVEQEQQQQPDAVKASEGDK
jgi:hypothetical protein